MSLQSRPVDPRDVSVEIDTPTFRVYFWQPLPTLACREFEVTRADVGEVVEWADRNQQDDETYMVGVLTFADPALGTVLTRIKGVDPSRSSG